MPNPEMRVVYAAKFWSNVFCSGEKVMYIVRCLSTAHLFFPLSMLLTLQFGQYLSALMSSPSDSTMCYMPTFVHIRVGQHDLWNHIQLHKGISQAEKQPHRE